MEQDKSVSGYFDFSDAAFPFDSNFEEEIPSKHLKVDKKNKQSSFTNKATMQNAKRTEKLTNPTKMKKTEVELNPNTSAVLKEFSQNPDTNKPMDMNAMLQEMNQGLQETLSNFAPMLIARENYEDECLQYVKKLTHHSQLQLQKCTAQKEKLCNKLDQITDALKRKT